MSSELSSDTNLNLPNGHLGEATYYPYSIDSVFEEQLASEDHDDENLQDFFESPPMLENLSVSFYKPLLTQLSEKYENLCQTHKELSSCVFTGSAETDSNSTHNLIDTIPKIYFEENFCLKDFKTFNTIFYSGVPHSQLIKDLENHHTAVENELMIKFNKNSHVFFSLLNNLNNLKGLISNASDFVCDLKPKLINACKKSFGFALNDLYYRLRKEYLVKLCIKLHILKGVTSAISKIVKIISNRQYFVALDAIIMLKTFINIELDGTNLVSKYNEELKRLSFQIKQHIFSCLFDEVLSPSQSEETLFDLEEQSNIIRLQLIQRNGIFCFLKVYSNYQNALIKAQHISWFNSSSVEPFLENRERFVLDLFKNFNELRNGIAMWTMSDEYSNNKVGVSKSSKPVYSHSKSKSLLPDVPQHFKMENMKFLEKETKASSNLTSSLQENDLKFSDTSVKSKQNSKSAKSFQFKIEDKFLPLDKFTEKLSEQLAIFLDILKQFVFWIKFCENKFNLQKKNYLKRLSQLNGICSLKLSDKKSFTATLECELEDVKTNLLNQEHSQLQMLEQMQSVLLTLNKPMENVLCELIKEYTKLKSPSLDEYSRIYQMLKNFCTACQALVGPKKTNVLEGVIQNQLLEHMNELRFRTEKKVKKLLKRDPWTGENFGQYFLFIFNCLYNPEQPICEPTNFKDQVHSSIKIEGSTYYFSRVQVMFFKMLFDYLMLLNTFPEQVPSINTLMVSTLRHVNNTTKTLILERKYFEANFTGSSDYEHFAFAHHFLEVITLLIPKIKKRLENSSSGTFNSEGYEIVLEEYRATQRELYISLMSQTNSNLDELFMNNRPDVALIKLLQHTSKLHQTLSKLFSNTVLNEFFKQTIFMYNNLIKAHLEGVKLKSAREKRDLLKNIDRFIIGILGILNAMNSGKELIEFVKEMPIKDLIAHSNLM